MATYKVIQDVEAEDKILGPLTLRQFIYAGVAAILLYLCYFLTTRGLGFMIAVFLPIALIFAFFAFPWGRDQPTEIWALAKIRYFLKPRRRIWDQSGVKELVTITAPKHVDGPTISHMSQTEVRSRLRALADTIDSRGWAIKNAAMNSFTPAPLILQQPGSSDRLLDVRSVPQQTLVSSDVQASDDMLDEKANPRAQRVESMISESARVHRQKLVDELNSNKPDQAAPAADYWFLNQPAQPVSAPSGAVTFNTQVVTPGAPITEDPGGTITSTSANPTPDEEALVQQLAAQKQQGPYASYYEHLRTIQPLSVQKQQAAQKAAEEAARRAAAPPPPPTPPPQPPVTPTQQAAILQLANNDDLNVATIAREAKRAEEPTEVVIKLH